MISNCLAPPNTTCPLFSLFACLSANTIQTVSLCTNVWTLNVCPLLYVAWISLRCKNIGLSGSVVWVYLCDNAIVVPSTDSFALERLRQTVGRNCKTVRYQSGSSLSSRLSSGSNPEPTVNLSHGMFHSRLKTYLFSKSFPPYFPLSHGLITR